MNRILLTLALVLPLFSGIAQTKKMVLSHDVYDSWNDLVNPQISGNGRWVTYEVNPQDGDGFLWLIDNEGESKFSFPRGFKATISPLNDFITYQVKPQKSVNRKAKIDKKKKDDMPKDSLKLYVFDSKKSYSFAKLKSYKTGEIGGNWVAIFTEMKKKEKEKEKQPADTSKKEKPKVAKKPLKNNDEDKPGLLTLLNPVSDTKKEFTGVLDYAISRNGSLTAFNGKTEDTLALSYVQIYDLQKGESQKIFEQKGDIKNVTIDETGSQLVFLFSADTGKVKNYEMYYWPAKDRKAELLISTQTLGMPKRLGCESVYKSVLL